MNITMNMLNDTSGIILRNAAIWAIGYLDLSSHDNIDVEIVLDDMVDGLNGMLIDENEHSYLIVLDDRREIGHIIHTLFHEMVHVRQHLRDGLGMKLESCAHIPYLEREWEIEAVRVSSDMMKEYIALFEGLVK